MTDHANALRFARVDLELARKRAAPDKLAAGHESKYRRELAFVRQQQRIGRQRRRALGVAAEWPAR